jgi:Ni/Fe-hydrogenase subunit HybB-like protein
MDRKRLSAILPWVTGGGLCLAAALKLAFQLQATDELHEASGHVEAIRFAPRISSDWDYITTPQMIALCVVLVAVLALAAWMLLLKFQIKYETPPPDDGATSELDAPAPPPGRGIIRSFGRRTR